MDSFGPLNHKLTTLKAKKKLDQDNISQALYVISMSLLAL